MSIPVRKHAECEAAGHCLGTWLGVQHFRPCEDECQLLEREEVEEVEEETSECFIHGRVVRGNYCPRC